MHITNGPNLLCMYILPQHEYVLLSILTDCSCIDVVEMSNTLVNVSSQLVHVCIYGIVHVLMILCNTMKSLRDIRVITPVIMVITGIEGGVRYRVSSGDSCILVCGQWQPYCLLPQQHYTTSTGMQKMVSLHSNIPMYVVTWYKVALVVAGKPILNAACNVLEKEQ